MTPKLRTIITTKRVGTVSRKEIRAAIKAVMAERSPEMEAVVRGETIPAGSFGPEIPVPPENADEATYQEYRAKVKERLDKTQKRSASERLPPTS
jgi:hypothetical protein